MKRFVTVLFALSLAVPVLAGETTDKPWFDMANCDFCKSMSNEPGLMDHVTWENHLIDNGALSITSVDPQYAAAFAKASQQMEALGNKMMSGEINPATVKMCGHCTAFGQLLMTGAKMQSVKGENTNVEITLLTSEDPAMVAKIHEFTERNIAEMKKMMAAPDHPGHDHH